ncbi:precorrin-2 C(20)-methyltransferase [Anaerocolumna xylanovorans]|uniref:Precorrin-2/cobalt-factor-2 C20-methyltransferase n=1 Tax=Anaerocolumna xylanovorans DSM 12503 TaxID=1121345 RepID=A0A1M7XZ96_9FIRM|nr:precorrin-2 C(20)-methyltransferase [Anaerocolumna xylanovorans]SHO44234.1 precorrin-2/cobalt-factor-2 C20-methyltransferase [Anaerocolumna xylanovorans DSM 12503]
MRSILYGIGVGPGDPELLTLKALRCIKESDVIILPSQPKEECYAYNIVKKVYPQIDEKEIVCLPFPMIKEKEKLKKAHDEIYGRIAEYLAEQKAVAFLTIGDPCVYSTYSYIHTRVTEDGGNAVIINGVPSFCAVSGALGISLGDNKDEIHIIPASYDIMDTLNLKGTRIYMKSGEKLKDLKEALLKHGPEKYEVYAVSNCGMENEKIRIGLNSLDEKSGYLTVVIVKEKKALTIS